MVNFIDSPLFVDDFAASFAYRDMVAIDAHLPACLHRLDNNSIQTVLA